MTTGTQTRKRRRFSIDLLQAKLLEVYHMAKAEERVHYQETGHNIVVKCPFVKCLCSGKSVEYSLIVGSRDETTFEPLTFLPSPDRGKLLSHLRKIHKAWYHDENNLINESYESACSGDFMEIYTGEEDHIHSDYIEEEEEGEEGEEEEEPDMMISEDLDLIMETVDRLPTKPCRTAKDMVKYAGIPIGGGAAPGCGSDSILTAMKAVIGIQELRLEFNLTQACVNKMLPLCISLMGGKKEEQNIMPPSIHELDEYIGLMKMQSICSHICPCSYQYPLETGDKKDEDKKKETCPDCQLNRYDIMDGRLQPKMKMYYFGVKNQIGSLFRIPEFRRQRTRGRGEADGIYKSTSITEDLHSIVPRVFETNRSIYSIAIDGAQPFKKRVHSSTKIVLRCEDLPLSHRCKGAYTRTLAIIPGPKEPSDHNPYLCVIAREFNELMEQGMKIKYINLGGEDEETVHYPILRFIHGDAKAMEKTHQYVSCTAKNGCRFCTQIASQHSIAKPDGKTMSLSRMTGFTSDAPFLTPGEEDTVIHLTRTPNAQVPRYNITQTWDILSSFKEALQEKLSGDDPNGSYLEGLKKRYGWKGFPKVFEVAKTLNIIDSTPLPIYHNLLLGIVKNFVQYLYDGLKKGKTHNSQSAQHRKMKLVISKKELHQLERGIFANCHVRKPYSRLELCYTWISEEVGVFLELYSPLLFDSEILGKRVISQEAEHAWHILRQAVLYYLGRPTEERIDANLAHEKLYMFAKLCEEENVPALVKPNLHTAICRLREQEKVLGHPKHLGELWMERSLRSVSSTNTVSLVEESLTKLHLLVEAIERQKYMLGIPIDVSAIPKYQPRRNLPQNFTTLCDVHGEICHDSALHLRLKGPGSEIKLSGSLNTGNDPICRKMGEFWIKQRDSPGNSRLGQNEFKLSHGIIQFKSMVKEREDGEICGEVKSKSKTTERKRKSYLVEVPYQAINEVTGEIITSKEIAEVDVFFMVARVERSSQGKVRNIAGEQQRFALCHLLKTNKENGFYILEYKTWESAFLKKDLVIPLSEIGNKVNGITTIPQLNNRGEVIQRMVFKTHLTDYNDSYSSD